MLPGVMESDKPERESRASSGIPHSGLPQRGNSKKSAIPTGSANAIREAPKPNSVNRLRSVSGSSSSTLKASHLCKYIKAIKELSRQAII